MLLCGTCKKEKPEGEFPLRKERKRGRSYKCRDCKSAYNKIWYEKNKKKHRKNVLENNRKNRKSIIDYVNKVKSVPCKDCDKKYDPVCMDFDHLDPSEKVAAIAVMVRNNLSIDTIKKEIEKCEVVCANCHRLRTKIRLCSSNG